MLRNPYTFILPQFSNREDFYLQLGVFDDDTGDAIDMASLGWTFQFEIRRAPPRGDLDAFTPWYDEGDQSPIITATNGTGPGFVNIVDVGDLLIWIPESVMKKLHHRTYSAALVANDGTRQFQVFKAMLPIYRGGVTN